jgi:hypothetical protein
MLLKYGLRSSVPVIVSKAECLNLETKGFQSGLKMVRMDSFLVYLSQSPLQSVPILSLKDLQFGLRVVRMGSVPV